MKRAFESAVVSRNFIPGEFMMGNWADKAVKRFHDESSNERKTEELEIQRLATTKVGAETLWKSLVRYVNGEVKSCNVQMGREFLKFLCLDHEVEIHAPKLWLSVCIDSRKPEIKFSFQEPYPSLKKIRSGQFPIMILDQQVCVTDGNGSAQAIETIGASLLDSLII
jgi:hypothetical protein